MDAITPMVGRAAIGLGWVFFVAGVIHLANLWVACRKQSRSRG